MTPLPWLDASSEPPRTESEAFWVADLSPSASDVSGARQRSGREEVSIPGWTADATRSPAPETESLAWSRVDFWESGVTLSEIWSPTDLRPRSDMLVE